MEWDHHYNSTLQRGRPFSLWPISVFTLHMFPPSIHPSSSVLLVCPLTVLLSSPTVSFLCFLLLKWYFGTKFDYLQTSSSCIIHSSPFPSSLVSFLSVSCPLIFYSISVSFLHSILSSHNHRCNVLTLLQGLSSLFALLLFPPPSPPPPSVH